MSQRNRGIYEPEFRLILAQTMLFGVFGYIGWAVGYDHQMPWIGAVACLVYVIPPPLFILAPTDPPPLPFQPDESYIPALVYRI